MSTLDKLNKAGLSSFWRRVSAYVHEVVETSEDALLIIGNTPLGTAATTISGAIRELVDKLGSETMGTTATTLTGAIAEHSQEISDLNSNTILYESSFTSSYGTFVGGTNENNVQIFGNVVILNARIKITSAYTAWRGGPIMKINGVCPPRYIVTDIGYGTVGAVQVSSNNSCEVHSGTDYSVGNDVRIAVVFLKK